MKTNSRALALLFSIAASACWGVESKQLDETISVDFPNESRKVIIRNVADLYELNIVWPETIPNDIVSMRLRDVTWRDIFDTALAGSGFTFFLKGNVVWIVEVDSPVIEIAKAREREELAVDENTRLRRAIRLLLARDGPVLSEEKRNEIFAVLSDPNRPAAELFPIIYRK